MPDSLFFNKVRVSFLTKLQAAWACNFIKKETLAQVFSYEYCEISKNSFLYKATPVAASKESYYKSSTSFFVQCKTNTITVRNKLVSVFKDLSNHRSSHRRCFVKKTFFLKISQYSQENNCVGFSF